jgi:4-amino-4-deoxy-L-arabinose transferase-like glycosyltransferase
VAHSGFATTDIAFVASYLLVLWTLRHVLARPGARSGALLGVTLGLAVATKFSTLVFLPPAAFAVVVCHYWDQRRAWRTGILARPALATSATAAVLCAAVIWGCYGFHIGRLSELPEQFGPYGTMPTRGWPAAIRNWRIPGHEFVHGLLFLQAHTIAGHRATLFDQFSERGFLIYYPVVLATKTPTPFLLLAALGIVG